MIKKFLTVVVSALALNISIAKADVINYVVKVDGVNKSYSSEELQQSFLNYKSEGDNSDLYNTFIKDLSNGEFMAFQDETKKFVNYEEILTNFLNSKTSKTKFDLNKFVKEAKGIEVKAEKAIAKNSNATKPETKPEIKPTTSVKPEEKKSDLIGTSDESVNGVYVNKVKIEKSQTVRRYGKIYVPLAPVASRMGDKILEDRQISVELMHGTKTLYFSCGASVFYEDYDPKPLLTKVINGISVPDGCHVISWNDVVYVPTEVLEREFGYKVTIANNGDSVYIGEVPEVIPKNTNPVGNTTNNKPNKKKAVNEGWVCPQVKSKSSDDLMKDVTTLKKELELDDLDDATTKVIKFSPDGILTGTTIGRPSLDSESKYYTSLQFFGYHLPNGIHDKYFDKCEKVNPQILKFYFPTKWQYIHSLFMNSKVKPGRYNWDGRNVLIKTYDGSIEICFSKVGEKLGM